MENVSVPLVDRSSSANASRQLARKLMLQQKIENDAMSANAERRAIKGRNLQGSGGPVFSRSLFPNPQSAESPLFSHLFCAERCASHPRVTNAAAGGGTPGTPEGDAGPLLELGRLPVAR